MFGLGTWELILILLVVLLLFGANRLPELGRGLGQALRGFKGALSGGGDERPPEPGGKGKEA